MNSFDDKCSKIGVVLSIDFFIWHFILFYRYFSLRDKDGQIDSEQRGLFRTNCIDSLDRLVIILLPALNAVADQWHK